MRDVPFDLEDDDDFRDYLEHVHETFLVYLDEQQVLLCENLGEFVELVYREIQADHSLLNNHEAMYDRMIGQMNLASVDQRRSEFVLEDLDAEYERVLKDRSKSKWAELGYAVQLVLGADLARIQMKSGSKVMAWILFVALLAGMVFVGVNNGFFLTVTLCLVGLIAGAKIVDTLPCCVSESGISLRKIMDRRIERLASRQLRMSLVEVQTSIFDSFESWCGDQKTNTVDNDTVFPY